MFDFQPILFVLFDVFQKTSGVIPFTKLNEKYYVDFLDETGSTNISGFRFYFTWEANAIKYYSNENSRYQANNKDSSYFWSVVG